MNISDLLQKCGLKTNGLTGNIKGISTNSKKTKDCLFVAIKGLNHDGHNYIDEAIKNGALAVVAENSNIIANNTSVMLSKLASVYYKYDPRKMTCIGITGTNAKTTTSYMLANILSYLGIKVGVIGTIGSHYKSFKFKNNLTTPDAITLHKILNKIEKLGGDTCIMEVSSHAIVQSRVSAIKFQCSIFTNLTAEHLDYHKNIDEYFNIKSQIFFNSNLSVICTDCKWGMKLAKMVNNKIITYGTKNADVMVSNIKSQMQGIEFDIVYSNLSYKIKLNMVGKYNAINFAGCFAACVGLGHDPKDILRATIQPVPGRMELVVNRGIHCFVDYSHTEDALSKALGAINEIKRARIITVFGCGGGRDKEKRPKMAKVAQSLSDYVIVTSDNPRFEKEEDIINQVKSGFTKNFKEVEFIPDRGQAIERALELANQNDIVLVAGKGHEQYQIIEDKKISFCDKTKILNAKR